MVMHEPPRHIEWVGDAATGHLRLLDQTRLPAEIVWLDCRNVESVRRAIHRLSVRGAPAIGIAAAYGCVLGAQQRDAVAGFEAAAAHLATSRPTAVNLFQAIDRMKRCAAGVGDDAALPRRLLEEAQAIHEEDRAACRAIGEHALALLRELTDDRLALLTHCNAGALATGGIGTATAPMYLAAEQHLPISVFADETRPLLQGSRLTAWELAQAGIDVSIITDSAAATVMNQKCIAAVITGADRIAANGDVANKIGTYGLAVLARHHGLPFVVAAPTTTIDLNCACGEKIPIEHRAAEEITQGFGRATAPPGAAAFAPAFDVTPADLITAIVTERGVIRPVTAAALAAQFDSC